MTPRRRVILVVAVVAVVALAGAGILAARFLGGSATAPETMELTGDAFAHDPALVVGEGGDPWYVFSTGDDAIGDGNIQVRTSPDGVDWTGLGTVWPEKPEWLSEEIPGVGNLWAPELYEHDGTWYLYYSASTFGSNRSLIALATNTTLDPSADGYEWVDRGVVVESVESDDFNAIDPGIVEDADGAPWMVFGSFWSGLRMVPLEWPTGMRADDAEPLRIADRGSPPNAIEAGYIQPHDGYYYLFFSRDSCCRGLGSTYNMAVGRSQEVQGPYVDKDGVPLLENGGTSVLASDGSVVGPGGQSLSGGYLAYHFYDGDNGGAETLSIAEVRWDADGWPEIDQGFADRR